MESKHPIQPLAYDEKGVLRFKANAIVQYLLDNGGIDLNKIACLPFSKEDRQQFAQLIGYSLSGYSTLSYSDNQTCEAAVKMFDDGLTEDKARIKALEAELNDLKAKFVKLFSLPLNKLAQEYPEYLE